MVTGGFVVEVVVVDGFGTTVVVVVAAPAPAASIAASNGPHSIDRGPDEGDPSWNR